MAGGGSAKALCSAKGVTMKMFTTNDCSGHFHGTIQPTEKCITESQGGFVENVCVLTNSYSDVRMQLLQALSTDDGRSVQPTLLWSDAYF